MPRSSRHRPRGAEGLLAVLNRQVSIENIQKTVADISRSRSRRCTRRSASVPWPSAAGRDGVGEGAQPAEPSEIGEASGPRPHDRLHACRKTQELRETDQDFARDYPNCSKYSWLSALNPCKPVHRLGPGRMPRFCPQLRLFTGPFAPISKSLNSLIASTNSELSRSGPSPVSC